MKFSYCQAQCEGRKMCKIQCDHCALYYAPLEKKILLNKQIKLIDKKIETANLNLAALHKGKTQVLEQLDKLYTLI